MVLYLTITLYVRKETQLCLFYSGFVCIVVYLQDVHTYNIGNLQESTSYIARLQALSDAGAGKVASITFRTPVLETQKPVGK